jgi:pimeloyl-ACP methyl ester carboxylesterase
MLLVLPGLDGTGELLAPFIAAAPPGCRARALRLPEEGSQSYPRLAEWLHSQLPEEPVVLVAESFSVPLAILVAGQRSHAASGTRVLGLVLSTAFVQQPLPGLVAAAIRYLPSSAWERPPPELVLRTFLTGGDARLAAALRQVMLGVSGKVIAERLAVASAVDVSAEFRELHCPVSCLHAGRDRLLDARSCARMRATRPDADYVQIVDAPHLLLQTRPAEVWSHVTPFLERIAQPRARAS